MSTKSSANKPLIIFCHGSGDTGEGAQAWIRSLIPPAEYERWDWSFPTAKPIPYTINRGVITSVWYDRVKGFEPKYPEQTASVEASTDRLLAIIDEEIKQSRSPDKIVIGGFSMGGAIALQTAARYHARYKSANESLGAVFGLSCYLNDDSKAWKILQDTDTAKNWPSTYMAHGERDDFISPQWGKKTYERLVKVGISAAAFQLVPNTYHEMVHTEIAQLFGFLAMQIKLKDNNEL